MTGSHICDICGNFKGKYKRQILNHKKQVHGVGEKSVYDCLFCTKQFNLFSILNIHIRCHTKEQPFFCKICPAEFNNKPNLGRHLQLHNPKRKPKIHCKIYSKGFFTVSDFRRHQQIHSTVKKPFKCDKCHKEFLLKGNLKHHMKTHLIEKPFVCVICEMSFALKCNLEGHIRTHLNWEKRFPCQNCSKVFKTPQNVNVHTKQVHMKDTFKFNCQKCGKKFPIKSQLTAHEFVHNEIPHRKYCCSFCGKFFGTNRILTEHLRGHTRERPFQCEVCKMRFMRSSDLNKHRKRSHSFKSSN